MDHYLTGTGIRLSYLQDRRALAEIDWPAIFDDLMDAGAPPNRCLWCDLDRMTHVILAFDQTARQYAGILGLIEAAEKEGTCLAIEAAMARPLDGTNLISAMLVHGLVRVACLDGKPAALSANKNSAAAAALQVLGRQITAARPFPPETGNIIDLQSARFARLAGRGGAFLDLREAREARLLRELRAMHHYRAARIKSKARSKPATSVGATRHPRKATRTGRTG